MEICSFVASNNQKRFQALVGDRMLNGFEVVGSISFVKDCYMVLMKGDAEKILGTGWESIVHNYFYSLSGMCVSSSHTMYEYLQENGYIKKIMM